MTKYEQFKLPHRIDFSGIQGLPSLMVIKINTRKEIKYGFKGSVEVSDISTKGKVQVVLDLDMKTLRQEKETFKRILVKQRWDDSSYIDKELLERYR